MIENYMKNCNHCRFFDREQGCCTKQILEVDLENNIDTIIEDGLIEASIREGFSDKTFNSISKKKQSEFTEEFENAKNNWVEEISEQVSRMLRNNFSYEYGVTPKDSREFCCNQWD
ncbi:MAG: hypothetical protein WCY38_06485 [Endomicrobiia bacterium]